MRRYEQRDGAFATLTTDVTNAWFEGRGPTSRSAVVPRRAYRTATRSAFCCCATSTASLSDGVRRQVARKTQRHCATWLERSRIANGFRTYRSSSIEPWVQQGLWQGCGATSCASSPPCLDLRSIATAKDSRCRCLRAAHLLTCTAARIRPSVMRSSRPLDRPLAQLACRGLRESVCARPRHQYAIVSCDLREPTSRSDARIVGRRGALASPRSHLSRDARGEDLPNPSRHRQGLGILGRSNVPNHGAAETRRFAAK